LQGLCFLRCNAAIASNLQQPSPSRPCVTRCNNADTAPLLQRSTLRPDPSTPLPLPPTQRNEVGDWEAAGAQFYSRELLYDMEWIDVDLETKR